MKPFVLAVIFARGGSKGVPRKNIRLFNGKPLIAHAIETALASRFITRVVVSTDDPEIADVSKQHGAEVPFLRPADLARDDSPEWLAWRHAIRELSKMKEMPKMDVMVSLPPTSPLRSVADVDNCVQGLLDSDADIVITVKASDRNPYFNMVTLDDAGMASLVVKPNRNIERRQDAPSVYDMTTVAYAVHPQFVMTANSIFEGRVKAVEVPRERAIDIDTELDFKFAEFMQQQSQME